MLPNMLPNQNRWQPATRFALNQLPQLPIRAIAILLIGLVFNALTVFAQDVSTKITPAPAVLYQDFGSATAVSSQTAAVGAPGDVGNKGAVYLYELVGSTWQVRPKLIAPDGNSNDRFGASVALHNGVLVIGAPGVNNNVGAVYVFVKSGNNWVPAQKFMAAGGIIGDAFGTSVAVSDGIIAVGAYSDNQVGNDAGAVYIFTGSNASSWIQAQKIVAYDGILQDEFGISVSLNNKTLAVGSRYSDVPGTPPLMYANAGAVYVYEQVVTPPAITPAFVNVAKRTAADRQMNDYLGNSVSITDGLIIAGAYGDDDYGTNSGSAYIFNGANFVTQTKITASDAAANHNFGWSVSISQNTALVGARFKNSAAGAAYAYTYNGATWTQFGTILNPTNPGSATGQFGHAVATNNNAAVIGAFRDTQNGTNAGAAYFYQFLAQPSTVTATDGVFEQFVRVSWVPHPTTSASSYTIYKYKNGNLLATFANATLPYDDYAVDLDTLYNYCVAANHPLWGQSQPLCDIGYKGTIASPANFTATDDLYEDHIALNWQNVSTLSGLPNPKCIGGIIKDSIIIYKNGGIIDTLPTSTTSYNDFAVYSTIQYDYCLRQFYAEYDTVFNILQTIYDFDTIPAVITSLNDDNQPYLRVIDTIQGNPLTYNVETIDTVWANTTYVYDTVITRIEIMSSNACDVGSASIKKPLAFAATYPFNGSTFNVDYYEDRTALSWVRDFTSMNTGYRIYRNGDVLVTINDPAITNFDDYNAVSNEIYEYCLVAIIPTIGESVSLCEFGGNRIRPPATVTASDGTFENQVTIAWTLEPNSVAEGVRIYKGDVLIADLPVFLSPHIDVDVVGLVEYDYCIEAYHGSWGTSFRTCDKGKIDIKKPVFTSITNGNPNFEDKIVLNWTNPSAVAAGYRLYRDDALLATITTPGTLTYTDQGGITSLQTYDYEIESYSPTLGNSERSTGNGKAVIKSPTNVQATDGTYGNKVVVTWADGSSLPGRSFRIYRNGFLIATRPLGTTSYEDFTVNSQSIYQYCVLTYKSGLGESDPTTSCNEGSTQTAPPSSLNSANSGAKLIPSITGAYQQAGYSVDISGDRIVMGAPGNPGNAFVFKGENGVWTEEAVLPKPSETVTVNYTLGAWCPTCPIFSYSTTVDYSNSRHGESVSIDGTRIIVGIPNAGWQGSAVNQAYSYNNGAVMVYEFSSSTSEWVHDHTKKSSDYHGVNTNGYDRFGASVDLQGAWAAIGAPDFDGGGHGYRYDANANGGLSAANGAYLATKQGTSVALFNGGSNVLLGDPTSTNGGSGGMVWQSGISGWLWSSNAGERFGTSLAIVNSSEVLIGAPLNNDGATQSGAVYLFNYNSTGGQNKLQTIKAPTATAYDNFGRSVAVAGDRAVIGLPGHDSNGPNAGAVFVYQKIRNVWQAVAKLVAPDPGGGYDEFGHSVAMENNTVVIGAPLDDSDTSPSSYDHGSAYVYVLPPQTLAASDGAFSNRVKVQWANSGYSNVADGFRIYRDGDLISEEALSSSIYYDYDAIPGQLSRYCLEVYSNVWGSSYRVCDEGFVKPVGRISGEVKSTLQAGVPDIELVAKGNMHQHALQFNAAQSNFVNVATSINLANSDFTIEYWAKLPATGSERAVFSFGNTSNNIISGFNATGQFGLNFNNTGNTLGADTTTWNNQWNHYAVAFNNGTKTAYLYRNGVLVKSGSMPAGFNSTASELYIGSYFGTNNFYNGMIDEVRVWNILLDPSTIVENKNRYLRGDETGLKAYYAFSEGNGGMAADFALNQGAHASIKGAFWTYDTPPVYYGAVTNAAGYYEINNIFFGSEAEFNVRPIKEGHDFAPTFQNRTLTTFNNLANNVNFTDNTVFSVTGKVVFNTLNICPQDSVQIWVNGTFYGNFTDLDGTYALALNEPGNYIIEPRNGDHVFSPTQINLGYVSDNFTDVNFTNTTLRTISGTVVGACNALIGDVSIRVSSDPPCLSYLVSPTSSPFSFNPLNGHFQFQGPPLKYNVMVETVVLNGQKNIQAENYFLSRSQNTNLKTEEADTLTFVYNKPFQLTLGDLPSTKTCDGLSYLMKVDDEQAITMEVFQNYNGTICPADSGTLYITDNVSDLGSISIPFYDGIGFHTLKPVFPETNAPYLKSFSVTAEVAGALTPPKQFTVLVTGSKPRESTFITKFPEKPFLILRDPPGDNSSSSFAEDSTTCNSNKFAYETVNTFGGQGQFTAGVKFFAGFGYYTGGEVQVITQYNLEFGISANGSTEWNNCTTALNQEFKTADGNPVLNGKSGNVYAGAGTNMIYALTDIIEYTNCEVIADNGIAIDPVEFATTFVYTQWHIENSLTTQYNEIIGVYKGDSIQAVVAGNPILAAAKGDSAREFQRSLLAWKNIIKLEDSLTKKALNNNFVGNYSFSAGADFASASTITATTTGNYEFYGVIKFGIALIAKVDIAGNGFEDNIFFKTENKIGGGVGFENSGTTTSSYTFSDDDVGDFFSVDVAQDRAYGVPVFKLKSGRSSCPYEPGTQTRFASDLILNDVPIKDNIPPDEAATFLVNLANVSQSNELYDYTVRMVSASNPDGAIVDISGETLAGGIDFTLAGGQSLPIIISVYKGPIAYDYMDLQVMTYASCEIETWNAGGNLWNADTLTFSVRFINPCSDITIASPIDNWLVHGNSGNLLPITIANYDTTSLDEVHLNYRSKIPGSPWLPITAPITRAFLTTYLDGFYTHTFNVAGLDDGEYEIRARTICQTATGTAIGSSENLGGVIDRSFNGLYGTPQPSDGVLAQGDLIYVDFSEVINCLIPTALNPTPTIVTPFGTIPKSIHVVNITTGDTLQYGSNFDYTLSCGGNGGVRLQYNIKPEILDQIEGHLLQITVADAQDIFGNHIGAPISWSFVVQRRQVYWNPPTVNITMYQGSIETVPLQLINVGAATRTFSTSVNNPATLSHTVQGNATSIAGNSTLNAEVTINSTQLPFGVTYSDTLRVDVNSLLNPAQVEFTSFCIVRTTVLAKPPVWVVNPFDFEYSMNMVLELDMNPSPFIQNEISNDIFDRVAAFVNGQIRGVANIEKVFTNSGWKYIAFLDIYSNNAIGDIIEFRIWDADLGLQYGEEGPAHKLSTGTQPPGIFYASATFTDGVVAGSNNNPVRLHAKGRVQCIDLTQGWNWISFNILGNNMSLNKVLEGLVHPTTGDIIKSQDGFAQYTQGLGWVGSLQTIENDKAYLIKIAATSDVLCLVGQPVDAPLNAIALTPGWNWIGYTSQTEDEVVDALDNINFAQNDLIRSQVDGFAQYDGAAWSSGNLQMLEPGKGYKLYVQNPFDLTYPEFAPPAWSVNSRCYQYSMTIVGVLSVNLIESTDINDRITASVENGAIVCQPASVTQGTQMVQHETAVNRHLVYLNVYGDETSIGKPIQFQMYDASEDEIYTLTAPEDPNSLDTLRFQPDAVLGRLQDPYIFPFSTCNQVDIASTTDVSCAGNDGEITISVDMECGTRGRPCVNPSFISTPADGDTSQILTPYATDWEDVRFQYLYTADELRAAGLTEGTISYVGFNVIQKLSVLPINSFTIKLQCTSMEALVPGTFVPSGTTVFEGPVTTATGWNMHKLRYTYEWDGVSNIIVDVCYQQTVAEFYNDAIAVSETPYLSTLGMYDDDGFGGCDLTQAYYNYNKRPDIRFGICNVQYQWDDPLQQTTPIASNLTPGTYNLVVSFGNGCVVNHTVNINLIPPLTLNIPVPSMLNCFGDTNGTANVVATLGTPPYTYLWGNGQTGANVTGLNAGVHSVTVTDANNCDEVISVTINQPAEIAFNNVVVTNALCNGSANGAIALVAGGGTPPYSYLWSNGQTSVSINNLTAGSYTLTITDANNCAKTQTISVTEPNPLLASNNTVNLLCNGDGNGSITLTPQGGTPPYNYLWSNGQTSITATGLSGGTYQVTVTDSHNCTFVLVNIAVNEPAAITATNLQVPILCNGDANGSIVLTPAGGTPPFNYLWSNGQTGNTATGLSGGTYVVTITDANNCVKTLSIPFAEPSVLNALTTNTNLLCYGDNNASATVTGVGGTPPYSYLWSDGQTTATATQLVAGAYTYTVTDGNNCAHTGTVTVTQPPQFQVLSNGTVEEGNNGIVPTFYNVATVQFNGGTLPYNYQWNNIGYVTYQVTAPGLITVIYAEGAQWNLTVTDANGCGGSELSFTSNTTPNANELVNIFDYTIVSDNGSNSGSIQLFVIGGTSPYTYQWSGPVGYTGPTSGTGLSTITGLISGWYIVTVTDSSNPAQGTVGWFWVPLQQRGRGKVAEDDCSLYIYPNPFKEETNIEMQSGSTELARLDVYSIKGEWIGTIFNGELTAATPATLKFNAGLLPDGVYICRMTMSNGAVVTEKMVLSR